MGGGGEGKHNRSSLETIQIKIFQQIVKYLTEQLRTFCAASKKCAVLPKNDIKLKHLKNTKHWTL